MILSLVFFVISVCSLYFLSYFYLSRGSQLLLRPQLLLMALHHFWLLWFQLLMFVNLFIGFTNILAELQLNGSQQTNTATRSQTLVDHRCRVKLRKCKIWHNRLCGAFTLLNISHVLLFWRPVLCSEASQKIKIISFPSLPVKSLWNKQTQTAAAGSVSTPATERDGVSSQSVQSGLSCVQNHPSVQDPSERDVRSSADPLQDQFCSLTSDNDEKSY